MGVSRDSYHVLSFRGMNFIQTQRCTLVPVIYPRSLDGFSFQDSKLLNPNRQPDMVDMSDGYIKDFYNALRDESTSKACNFNNRDETAIKSWAAKKTEQSAYLWAVMKSENEEVIGFVCAKPLDIDATQRVFFISGGGNENYRNKGYGKEILSSFMPFLKTNLGTTGIKTSAFNWNTASLKLQQSAGFKVTSLNGKPINSNPEDVCIEFEFHF